MMELIFFWVLKLSKDANFALRGRFNSSCRCGFDSYEDDDDDEYDDEEDGNFLQLLEKYKTEIQNKPSVIGSIVKPPATAAATPEAEEKEFVESKTDVGSIDRPFATTKAEEKENGDSTSEEKKEEENKEKSNFIVAVEADSDAAVPKADGSTNEEEKTKEETLTDLSDAYDGPTVVKVSNIESREEKVTTNEEEEEKTKSKEETLTDSSDAYDGPTVVKVSNIESREEKEKTKSKKETLTDLSDAYDGPTRVTLLNIESQEEKAKDKTNEYFAINEGYLPPTRENYRRIPSGPNSEGIDETDSFDC